MKSTQPAIAPASDSRKRVSILARTIFREMQSQGFSTDQMIAMSSELLDLVGDSLSQRDQFHAAE